MLLPDPFNTADSVRLDIAEQGSKVVAHWVEISGGTLNHNQALIGGTRTPLSGVFKGLVYEVPARSQIRQFVEIKTGDIILDVAPDCSVELALNQAQSGVAPLSGLVTKGIRFEHRGRFYVPSEAGEELTAAWDVVDRDVPLMQTILLTRAK